jgi:hypothetical protein
LLKLKCAHSPLNPRILSSTSVPFTLTTVQVPNLALTHKKRITVWGESEAAVLCPELHSERSVSEFSHRSQSAPRTPEKKIPSRGLW